MTCKTVEQFALDTKATLKVVNERDIVTLKADWSEESPQITRWLDKLGAISIPVAAVFSPERPSQPLVLRDLYTQTTLLDVLDQATSSTSPKVQADRRDAVVR